MDRNKASHLLGVPKCKVALRKESVDRNPRKNIEGAGTAGSLSARRAWIEISVKDLNAHLY